MTPLTWTCSIDRAVRDPRVALFSELGYGIYREAGTFVQLSPPAEGAWPVDLMLVQEATSGATSRTTSTRKI